MKRKPFETGCIRLCLLLVLTVVLTGCRQQTSADAILWKAEQLQWDAVAGEKEIPFQQQTDGRWPLPSCWDNRRIGRTSGVRNQGDRGTCWSFSALGGLEALRLPGSQEVFSVDHMTAYHGYSLTEEEGGNFTMILAYLAGWRGPVWESDDPYADGVTEADAPVRAHLQEAKLLGSDSYAIKEAVLQNGAVQTSLYIEDAMRWQTGSTEYYQADTCAYYYDGPTQYNHDVLIVGWDDAFSRDRFTIPPPGDGAYICQNSWGEEFGEQGFFYVSYYDSSIATNTITYSRLDEPDRYDHVYQYDELGWSGQMGYDDSSAWGANVYTAETAEELTAVSFYTTGEMTDYKVYIDTTPQVQNFRSRQLVAQGCERFPGYYTIDLDVPVQLKAGQSFAVILRVNTPDSSMPLAAEYHENSDAAGWAAPQESYISLDGVVWKDAGLQLGCNVCIKAFTRR